MSEEKSTAQTEQELVEQLTAEAERDLSKEQNERVVQVVQAALEKAIEVGMLDTDTVLFKQLTLRVVQDLVLNHIMINLDPVFRTLEGTIAKNKEIALEKLWGKPFDQIGIADINNVVTGDKNKKELD